MAKKVDTVKNRHLKEKVHDARQNRGGITMTEVNAMATLEKSINALMKDADEDGESAMTKFLNKLTVAQLEDLQVKAMERAKDTDAKSESGRTFDVW